MNIGKMDKRVSLQSKVAANPAQNALGEPQYTWTTYATVWAGIKPLQGREMESAKQYHEKIDYQIKIRFRAGVTGDHRVLFGTRIFEIHAALNTAEHGEELKLLCSEVR